MTPANIVNPDPDGVLTAANNFDPDPGRGLPGLNTGLRPTLNFILEILKYDFFKYGKEGEGGFEAFSFQSSQTKNVFLKSLSDGHLLRRTLCEPNLS